MGLGRIAIGNQHGDWLVGPMNGVDDEGTKRLVLEERKAGEMTLPYITLPRLAIPVFFLSHVDCHQKSPVSICQNQPVHHRHHRHYCRLLNLRSLGLVVSVEYSGVT